MRRKRKDGFILGELIVALTVLGAVVISLALSLDGIRRFNHYQWTRQRCIAAAQAQLDCLAVSAHPFDLSEVQRLWPRVTTTLTSTPGEDQWEGLTLVTVLASSPSFQRQVRVRLSRYYPDRVQGAAP